MRLGARVEQIDLGRRLVRLADGEELPYDRLVIAVLALGYPKVVPRRGPKRPHTSGAAARTSQPSLTDGLSVRSEPMSGKGS